jgi:hypothetical protein
MRDRFEKASMLIQNFQRLRRRKFLSKLSKQALQRRKLADLSISSTDLLAACQKDPATHYHIPGINQRAPSFIRATQQKTIFCSGTLGFTPADCLMLCMVLRSPACAVRTLVLHHMPDARNPCFEFDLLAALRKCTSIRSVVILGGDWEGSFLSALVELVQTENPRIVSLVIEQVPRSGLFIDSLSQRVGIMLIDYFNYSIPGISELTLHGCNLGDGSLDLICQGIAVNSSIRFLTLSLNLIEDAGFVRIFKAFNSNRKSKIEKMDFCYNLIQSTREVKRTLLNYVPHSLNVLLVIYLMHNRIYEYYHPVTDIEHRGLTASSMTIIYTDDDLVAMKFPNYLVSARKTHATFDPPPPPKSTGSGKLASSSGSSKSQSKMAPAGPMQAGSAKLRLLKKVHSASTSSAMSLSLDGSASQASLTASLGSSRSLQSSSSAHSGVGSSSTPAHSVAPAAGNGIVGGSSTGNPSPKAVSFATKPER